MVAPIIPIAIADLLMSGVGMGLNFFQQQNNKKLWQQNYDVQKRLYDGQVAYLRKLGLRVNPDKAWSSYLSGMAGLQNNMQNADLGLASQGIGFAKHGMYTVGKLYNDYW